MQPFESCSTYVQILLTQKLHLPPLTTVVFAEAELALLPALALPLVDDFLEVVEFFRDTAAALFLTKSAKQKSS